MRDFTPGARGTAAALLAAGLLAGCASAPVSGAPGAAAQPLPQARLELGEAPAEVPPVLVNARRAPYAPVPQGCEDLEAEVAALDQALGVDFDQAPFGTRAGDTGGALGEDVERDLTGVVIPFANVLRYVSGSEQKQKAALAAILGGHIRRAYLKGLGEARGCAPPATPVRAAAPTGR